MLLKFTYWVRLSCRKLWNWYYKITIKVAKAIGNCKFNPRVFSHKINSQSESNLATGICEQITLVVIKLSFSFQFRILSRTKTLGKLRVNLVFLFISVCKLSLKKLRKLRTKNTLSVWNQFSESLLNLVKLSRKFCSSNQIYDLEIVSNFSSKLSCTPWRIGLQI